MKAKITLTCAAAALLAIVIVGCSSGPGGVNIGGGIFPSGGLLPKFLFVVADSDISAWRINAGTGAVTAAAGSPFGPHTCADEPAANPSGTFLFVPDECVDGVRVYSINQSSGALTEISGSPFPTGTGNFDVVQGVVDSTGSFFYVPEDSDCQIIGYTIGANGALTLMTGSPFPTSTCGGNDQGVVMHPTGKFLYVGGQSGNVFVFSINQGTGALTEIAGSPFAGGNATKVLVIPPSGKFLFVTNPENSASEGVLAFTIDTSTGALTPVAGSPFSTGTVDSNAQGAAVTPDGKFLFVANAGEYDDCINGDIAAFSVNASTGALTPVPGSPFTAGPNPQVIAVDPSGKFVYVTIIDAGEVAPNAGVLCDPAFTTPGAGGLYIFSINQTTGALTQISGSPVTTNVGPEGIAITHQ